MIHSIPRILKGVFHFVDSFPRIYVQRYSYTKKEDAKKFWQLIFDNMSSEMNDEEKASYEKALKEFKETTTDDLVDTIADIYYNMMLRLQSSSNQ